MYFLLAVSVFAASFNSVLLNKSGASGKDTVFKFNFLCSIVWCILLFLANGCTLHINFQVVLWGVLYGIAQICFLVFKTLSMSTGSVSVTTLIGNSSLLISIFVSLALWKEKVSVTDIVALLFLCLAIFLCTYKKSDKQCTGGWKYYVFFFFVFAASVGLIFKGFGKVVNLKYCGDMMLLSAMVMTLGNLVVGCFTGGKLVAGKQNLKAFLLFALGSGILSCLYNRLNIYLAGSVDAIIFFPCFNGGVVLLSTLLSVAFLKEKLFTVQKIGLIIGVISICVIGIF